jgi:hypothetical protein
VLTSSWLDHSGGNGQIDFELLWGTTLASMEKHRQARVHPYAGTGRDDQGGGDGVFLRKAQCCF